MANLLRKINTIIGIKKDLKYLNFLIFKLKRSKLIKRYFQSHNVYKLHLGSNRTLLNGWLCSDLWPQNNESIFLDVTKKLPFEDETFDYAYNEHLIEHLSLNEGIFMIKECFRILKKGGILRIATPDLDVVFKLFTERGKSFGKSYIKWSLDNFGPSVGDYDPVIVVNTLFHNWNHKFLYDMSFLRKILENSGFRDIQQFTYSDSNDINLRNIERHHENVGSIEMVKFETLIVEAVKD